MKTYEVVTDESEADGVLEVAGEKVHVRATFPLWDEFLAAAEPSVASEPVKLTMEAMGRALGEAFAADRRLDKPMPAGYAEPRDGGSVELPIEAVLPPAPVGIVYFPPVGVDKQQVIDEINTALADPTLKRDRIRVEGQEATPPPVPDQRERVAAAIARIDDAIYVGEPTTDAERRGILAVMRAPLDRKL